MEAMHGSLKRLGTDYVDLYWVHAWDELTPVEEVMRGLDDLVRAGKVHYVGISDAPAWWIARANTMAELRGWSPFVGLQIEYNLVERTPMSHRNVAIAKAVVQLGREIGKSPAQVALNWLRSKPGVIPILGARAAAQFADNMACLDWSLDEGPRATLEEISRIDMGFPTDFLHRKEVRDFLHGGLFERIRGRC